jgi:3-phosphoshikimate 1-carboxyvinyltransferase
VGGDELGPELEVEVLEGPLDATVSLPGSKSITNRALACAALADGRSVLEGVLFADDTEAMVSSLAALGVDVDADWASTTIAVDGTGGTLPDGPATADARMSGTTARFIAPMLALGRGAYRLTGHPQLRSRPMAPAFAALRELGVSIDDSEAPGFLPATIHATGGLAGGRLRVPGHLSSQFLSGLLMAAPAMRQGLFVELTTELVSRPYIDLTAAVMRDFGVEVGRQGAGSQFVVPAARYVAARHRVEPDASAASYFFAAAAVLGGRVRVEGLGRGTVQGDLRFVEVLARMGCEVEVGRGYTEVSSTAELKGVTVDMRELSDTAPTLAVVAAFASSPTTVTGVGFIRRKETDRIAAVVTELRRCGVDAVEEVDGFTVTPPPGGPRAARIETYDDHRMAMSFAVLGLRVPGTVIVEPACVAKTFPGFFEALDGLR